MNTFLDPSHIKVSDARSPNEDIDSLYDGNSFFLTKFSFSSIKWKEAKLYLQITRLWQDI